METRVVRMFICCQNIGIRNKGSTSKTLKDHHSSSTNSRFIQLQSPPYLLLTSYHAPLRPSLHPSKCFLLALKHITALYTSGGYTKRQMLSRNDICVYSSYLIHCKYRPLRHLRPILRSSSSLASGAIRSRTANFDRCRIGVNVSLCVSMLNNLCPST